MLDVEVLVAKKVQSQEPLAQPSSSWVTNSPSHCSRDQKRDSMTSLRRLRSLFSLIHTCFTHDSRATDVFLYRSELNCPLADLYGNDTKVPCSWDTRSHHNLQQSTCVSLYSVASPAPVPLLHPSARGHLIFYHSTALHVQPDAQFNFHIIINSRSQSHSLKS